MSLQANSLTKRYGNLTALSDVSFSIRCGEILGLIGPNGSGKTTLFECLAGVLPADSGTLRYGDRVVPPGARSAVLFYMPDGIAPWPSQTVRWALAFTAGFFGVSEWGSESVSESVPESGSASGSDIIRRLDLEPLLDMPIGALSKGQRKRVLLAIGLRTPQPVLLADEPFDGLDLRQTREVGRALRSYADAGRTLFLSIHQISDAARICDRFVLLSAGRVCGEGTLDELSSLAGAPTTDLEEIFLALT